MVQYSVVFNCSWGHKSTEETPCNYLTLVEDWASEPMPLQRRLGSRVSLATYCYLLPWQHNKQSHMPLHTNKHTGSLFTSNHPVVLTSYSLAQVKNWYAKVWLFIFVLTFVVYFSLRKRTHTCLKCVCVCAHDYTVFCPYTSVKK